MLQWEAGESMKPRYLLMAACAVLDLYPLQASRAAETGFEAQVQAASSLVGRSRVVPARFRRPEELGGFVSGYHLSPSTGQAGNCAPRIDIEGTGNMFVITFGDRKDFLLVEPNHFEPNGIFECNDPGNPYEFLNREYPGCLFRRWRAESANSIVMEVELAKLNKDGDLVWTSGRWATLERFTQDGRKLTSRRNYVDLQSECAYMKD